MVSCASCCALAAGGVGAAPACRATPSVSGAATGLGAGGFTAGALAAATRCGGSTGVGRLSVSGAALASAGCSRRSATAGASVATAGADSARAIVAGFAGVGTPVFAVAGKYCAGGSSAVLELSASGPGGADALFSGSPTAATAVGAKAVLLATPCGRSLPALVTAATPSATCALSAERCHAQATHTLTSAMASTPLSHSDGCNLRRWRKTLACGSEPTRDSGLCAQDLASDGRGRPASRAARSCSMSLIRLIAYPMPRPPDPHPPASPR